ncbi:MAG: hypothetical protein QXW71_02905 [Thermoplasmata archaeon]
MPAKVALTGFVIVTLLFITVATLNYFILLSAAHDFNTECRLILLTMEKNGGLTNQVKTELIAKLTNKGFESVTVNGTQSAAFGEQLTLSVSAFYRYKKAISFLQQANMYQYMTYNKTSVSRKVVN